MFRKFTGIQGACTDEMILEVGARKETFGLRCVEHIRQLKDSKQLYLPVRKDMVAITLAPLYFGSREGERQRRRSLST
jgi:hypothetical protein